MKIRKTGNDKYSINVHIDEIKSLILALSLVSNVCVPEDLPEFFTLKNTLKQVCDLLEYEISVKVKQQSNNDS